MTNLFRIEKNGLHPVQRSSLAKEEFLEDWIARDPMLIGLDVLIIGRQVVAHSNGRVDLLAITGDGNLVIIELKRDKTPREVVAQVLDYASWVTEASEQDIHNIAEARLGRPLQEAFLERFERPLPETINDSHSMVIVASELDPSSKRIVEYLAQEHQIAINTVFFRVFEDQGQQFLATEWLMDQQEVEERSENKHKLPWSGIWYANIGEGPHRSWEDMRKYGFLAAGGGRHYSVRLEQLSPGDPVYAYQKQAGYVGYGTVRSSSKMAVDTKINDKPLLELPLQQPNLAHDEDDPEKAEYVVLVDWHKTVPISEAQTFTGAFANQNVVCKLRKPATLEFLKRTFGAPEKTPSLS